MWLNALGLCGILGGLLLLHELLDAGFRSVHEGQVEDVDRDVKEKAGLLRALYNLLRALVSGAIGIGAFVGLVFHETMHALVQLAMGMRPRIVLCRNGGYAEGRPWFGGIGVLPLLFTRPALGGVCSMAPILGGGLLYFAILLWRTPKETAHVRTEAAALAERPARLPAVALEQIATVRRAGFLAMLPLVLVGLVTVQGLTPSSVDFVNARHHLPGYGIGAVLAVLLLERGLRWALLAAGIALFVLFVVTIRRTRDWPLLFGSAGATLLVLFGLGASASSVLAGLAMLAQVLLFAALVVGAFLGILVLLNAIGLQFDALLLMLRRWPGHLREVFTRFSTCPQCRLHFRGKCDGCGRTEGEVEMGS